MARSLIACIGLNGGGVEESDPGAVNIQAGVGTAKTHPCPTKQIYVAEHGWKEGIATYEKPFTDGHWLTTSFYIYFEHGDIPSQQTFFALRDGSGGSYCSLIWFASPTIRSVAFRDSNNAGSDGGFAIVREGSWRKFEIKIKPQSGTSPVIVTMDDNIVFQSTSEDCDPGNATDSVFAALSWTINDATKKFWSANLVIESDDGANIDTTPTLFNDRSIKLFLWDKTGATPDFGPDNLDAGAWENLLEIPLSDTNTAQYDSALPSVHEGGVTCDDAPDGGPKNHEDAENTYTIGASFGWRFKRTTGFFSNQTFVGKFGSGSVATTDSTVDTAAQSVSTSYQFYWEFPGPADSGYPPDDNTEWLQLGFKCGFASDNKDIILAEMWGNVVLEEAQQTGEVMMPHF